MDENEQDEILEEVLDEDTIEEEQDKPKGSTKETPEAKLARIEREAKQIRKKLGLEEEKPAKESKPVTKNESTTDGLDETQLDYLDLKGISEDEDIGIIERHVKRTGETVRQALKDDYVQSKLEANKQARAVKDATPSSTKRSGNQQSEASSIISKFEATGVMPEDFASREVIVDYLVKKDRSNAPSWHK